jgi:nucleoside-diphosphate-sugar epimerase
MRHVLITGAAGFIGGYAVKAFVDAGWQVMALVHRRTSPELEHLANTGPVTIIRGDLTDSSHLRETLTTELEKSRTTLDAIVHCAGRVSDVGWRSEFRRTNFESVKGLVRIVKELDVGRFVFVSTTDVYGLCDHSGGSEDEVPLRAYPSNPYPQFKIATEEFIRSELPARRFCIIRPAQVWGVGDQTVTSRIVNFLKWSPWIVHFGKWQGQNRAPLAHVHNVATMTFLAAIIQDAAGLSVNVVDEEKTTIDEFYRILARVYLPHKRFKTITFPFWIGQCMGVVVSGISNMFNLKRPFIDPSFYALYAVSHNLDFSNKRMKGLFSEAGCSLITRDAGIREIQMAESR